MPFNPPQRSSSRFNVLNFKSGPSLSDTMPCLDLLAPPPPPKELTPLYNTSFFSRSTVSLSPSLSPESNSGPVTPASPYPYPTMTSELGKHSNAGASPVPSASWTRAGRDYFPSPTMDGSTDSSGSCPNTRSIPNPNNGIYLLNSASTSSCTMSQPARKTKKSVFKLSSLTKRNRSRKDLSDTASASGSVSRTASLGEQDTPPDKAEGDEGISLPWNFQHHIHVDEGYIGLPPSWSSALSQVGFGEDEIAAIHARRRAAATFFTSSPNLTNTTYPAESPGSPHVLAVTPPSTSASCVSSSPTLINPAPRSTSLRKGREALTIQPPSTPYSVVTNTNGVTTPAPSPRAPSFSMRTFMSGFKNSLSSDSASTKEDVPGSGSTKSDSATGEESEQYVFIDGDGPDQGGVADETLIEPYYFDSSSISSPQSYTSRIRQLSEDQVTPRTPTFPQIQVHHARSDPGHVPFPSPASRAPSPLSHSASLPIPTPPHTHTKRSTSPSPRPGPLSAPPRTPPRRIYHIANASSDSYELENYSEPPPAYASPNEEWAPKEKEGGIASKGHPPPSRPIPPVPSEQILGEPSRMSNLNLDYTDKDTEASITNNSHYTTSVSVDDFPGTVDKVLDISSRYSDKHVHGGDAETGPAPQMEVLSPTPPLVIDKRMTKLAMLPPRISFHQEGSLEDWSESLFDVIGKRPSVLARSKGGDPASVKERKRATIRLMSFPSESISDGGSTSTIASSSLLPKPVAPSPPDIPLGTNLTLDSHAIRTVEATKEDDAQEQPEEDEAEETRETPAHVVEQVIAIDATTLVQAVESVDRLPITPSTSLLPDVSFGPNVSSSGKDLEPLPAASSSPLQSPSRDSLPSSPPPRPKSKPKPKPSPLALPPAVSLAPPRANVITGISGKSPVNSLFSAKPQPLPIPIPLSQIRAQLRPAPPKSPHPPPTLPLPPLKPIPHLHFQPPPHSRVSPLSSPGKVLNHASIASASPSDSRPNSSQTLHPARTPPGDRDSGFSTVTVTPATIATAKTEVVRTAVASIIDSDAVSLASWRESATFTADTEPQIVTYDKPDMGGESPPAQEHEEAPEGSMISETSSVSLLRDGPQSKWPAPPPPPVELGTDSPPHRISRFRTTSLGRVTQLQSMGGASSVRSHTSQGSSDTMSSSTSESASLTKSRGVNGVSPSGAPRTKFNLDPEGKLLSSRTGTVGGVEMESDSGGASQTCSQPSEPSSESISPATHPLLAQLQPYITPRDPASCFMNLVEIAEGESGSVFAARVVTSFAQEQQAGTERPIPPGASHVAIKRISLPPLSSSPSLSDDSSVSNKLVSVLHELCLLQNLDHEHLLVLDAVYVCSDPTQPENVGSASTVDTSLWIRMELMERSLADVIGLVAEGLALQERLVGRFASDILHGLDYLQKQHIAHRDVRSDNLLVNAAGVVKLADFSNGIRVDRNAPMVKGAVGVIYWQAPEMRAGSYNALKVDIWSLGATVWELAETVPPFSMPATPSTQMSFAIQTAQHVGSQWPPLTHPEHYSRAFHEFLKLCGRESAERPFPGELLNTQFIRNACGRPVILQLLSQCRAMEEAMVDKGVSTGRS